MDEFDDGLHDDGAVRKKKPKKSAATERSKMFSMLMTEDLLRKLSMIAAHKQTKKKKLLMELLGPYVEEEYEKLFVQRQFESSIPTKSLKPKA